MSISFPLSSTDPSSGENSEEHERKLAEPDEFVWFINIYLLLYVRYESNFEAISLFQINTFRDSSLLLS